MESQEKVALIKNIIHLNTNNLVGFVMGGNKDRFKFSSLKMIELVLFISISNNLRE